MHIPYGRSSAYSCNYADKAPASSFASSLIIAGNTVYLAGAVGVDASGKFIDGTIKDRTRQALQNAQDRLKFIGLDLGDGTSALVSNLAPRASTSEMDFSAVSSRVEWNGVE